MQQKQKYFSGFTLIELIIVISIISILSVIAYNNYAFETPVARDALRRSDLKTLEDSVAMSNAKGRSLNFSTSPFLVTTGVLPSDAIITNIGDIRVLRNAQLIQIEQGFVDTSILAKVSRDPRGSPYLGAFLSPTLFQIGGTLENPSTQIPEAIIRGSFTKEVVIDNVLVDIDNNDRLIPVGKADQFIRGDILQVGSEKMHVDDVAMSLDYLIVTRGFASTTATIHANRSSIKIVTFPANAGSLFCVGNLIELSASDTDATFLNPADVPTGVSVDLATVVLDSTYTCSAGSHVEDEKFIVLYDVRQ